MYSNAVTTVSPTYANEVLNGGAAGWLRETFARPEVGRAGWKRVCAVRRQRVMFAGRAVS